MGGETRRQEVWEDVGMGMIWRRREARRNPGAVRRGGRRPWSRRPMTRPPAASFRLAGPWRPPPCQQSVSTVLRPRKYMRIVECRAGRPKGCASRTVSAPAGLRQPMSLAAPRVSAPLLANRRLPRFLASSTFRQLSSLSTRRLCPWKPPPWPSPLPAVRQTSISAPSVPMTSAWR